MRTHRTRRFMPTLASLATAYDDQSVGAEGELVIPESFEGMDDAAVAALHTEAVEQFNALYSSTAEGTLTTEQIEQLAAMTEGIEALAAEIATRDAANAERAAAAAALAGRVQATAAEPEAEQEEGEEAADETEGDEPEAEATEEEATEEEAEPEAIAASAAPRREVRIPRSNVQRQAQAPAPREEAVSPVYSTGVNTGFAAGAGMTMDDVAVAVDTKLRNFNLGTYQAAARSGRALSEVHNIAAFRREFSADVTIDGNDRGQIEAALARAADPNRVVGRDGQRGLVASGSWCAPSQTLYDFMEPESRDGLLSLPEVNVVRGGINYTQGPDFADIFSQITGFSFTEQDDIDGKYQPGEGGNVVGPKPCYKIECPPFEDVRMDVDGICLTAGLLQSRGYPEVIARTIRGAMIAHEHRINSKLISKLVAGSTAVNMGNQVGAAAPILDSIEKQADHYRASRRLPMGEVLEAVFPFWVFGAIRSDLSRRLGVDLISVPDSRVRKWFADCNISAQFVYNWQAIDTTPAANFKAWPTTVSFLLYAAGTWVRGSSEIITLDTLYDSTLLAQNDFTALFTEEGWLVLKRGHDSRVVTVGIEASGGTHMGVDIAHDGTLVVAP